MAAVAAPPVPGAAADAAAQEDKAKRAVFYEACTSEFKDDIPTLVKCLRCGAPPHTRNEAGFLLWHHALSSEEQRRAMVQNGIMAACVSNMDDAEVPSNAKTCSIGILLALVSPMSPSPATACSPPSLSASSIALAEAREALVRARAATSSRGAMEVLHSHLHDTSVMIRQYSARTLRALADPDTVPVALKVMDNGLPHIKDCMDVWAGTDTITITNVTWFVAEAVQGRPDLAIQLTEDGVVEALMGLMRRTKSDGSACAAATCLARMMAQHSDVGHRLITAGAVAVLVDLLGPPPRTVVQYEKDAALLKQAEEAELELQLSKPKPPPQPAASSGPTPQQEAARIAARTLPLARGALGGAASPKCGSPKAAAPLLGTARAAAANNALPGSTNGASASAPSTTCQWPPPYSLSTSTCAMPWIAPLSPTSAGVVASLLAVLAQERPVLEEVDGRMATFRMATHVRAAMPKPVEGKKPSSKKKAGAGVALSPEQAAALTHMLALLKQLVTLSNVNKRRAARLGLVVPVVKLYESSVPYALHNHCQTILSSVALLAENGQALADAGLPEEFLVPNPMRLTKGEAEQVGLEFGDQPPDEE